MNELRSALELATEEELKAITDILFCRRFNPLDYAMGVDPSEVQSQPRHGWIDTVEQRFRFLAADGLTVLQRQTHCIDYRDILIRVCQFLKISYLQDWTIADLESEIFLHTLERVWNKLPRDQQVVLTQQVQRSLSTVQTPDSLPELLLRDPVRLMLKGSGAIAISSVIRPWLLQQIARQFALHAATYHSARHVIARGSTAALTQVQSRVAIHMAKRGMVLSAARYGAARGVLAVLGPAMWVWFFADLGWRAIATNYGRVIPVVVTLAQIRLLRAPLLETA